MDEKKRIEISNYCDCCIHISLRNTIDIGLKPVIQNITTIIAASMVNTDLFGNYAIDFLFILEEIFTLAHDSPLSIAYTMVLQEAIDVSIELKEKDTPGVVLQETLCQLLQPAMHKQPYMYDSFIIGNLHQVSSETYGIRIGPTTDESLGEIFLSCKQYKDDGIITVRDELSAIVVLQKEQLIPDTGVVINFDIGYKNKKRDAILVDTINLGNISDYYLA